MTRLAFDLANWVGWATIVATLATAIGVLVSAAALRSQQRQASFAATLDNLWRFDDDLHGADMCRRRLAAARGLKANQDVPEIVDVLNFFEMLGLVFRKKGIDPEVTLENFGWWVFGYWDACQGRIGEDRRKDPSAWEEFEGMKTALARLDRKKKRKASAGAAQRKASAGAAQVGPPQPGVDLAEFLDDELKLKVAET